jgi:hypothetical protein
MGGCSIKHPHGKYSSYVKTYAIPMSIAEQVEPDTFSFELMNGNSSRCVKIRENNGQYLYENTIYFDRFIHVVGIEVIANSEIKYVKINDLDEKAFSVKNESVNKMKIQILIVNEDIIPSDVISMNMTTITDK